MKKWIVSLCSLFSGIASQPVCAESLVQALQQGISRSPSLQYSLSQISASESSVNQARSGWLPNISVSAGQQATGETSDTGDNQYAMTVQQNLFDFGRTGDRVDNAKYNKGSQIWKAIDDAETVSSKVAESYFNILKGQHLLQNNIAEMIEHKRILELAVARAEGGVDNQGDVRQVEVRIRGLEASAESIQAQLQAAENEYQILVGAPPGVLEDTDLTFLDKQISQDLRELIRVSPQIRALQMEQAAVSSQYQYVRKSWLPQLSVSLSQGKTSIYGANDTQVMFNVTSNVFDGGNTFFQAENAAKQVESARWNVQKSMEDNATNVSESFQQALGYKQEAAIYKVRETQSKQVMSLYNDQYRVNRRSVLDLLNAAQEYYQTIDSQINSMASYQITMLRAVAKLGKINQAFGIHVAIDKDQDIESALNDQPNIVDNQETDSTIPQNIVDSAPPSLPAVTDQVDTSAAMESSGLFVPTTPPVSAVKNQSAASGAIKDIEDPLAMLSP